VIGLVGLCCKPQPLVIIIIITVIIHGKVSSGEVVLIYTLSQKRVHYLIFYNLKKPEPIFKIFGTQYPDNPGLLKHL